MHRIFLSSSDALCSYTKVHELVSVSQLMNLKRMNQINRDLLINYPHGKCKTTNFIASKQIRGNKSAAEIGPAGYVTSSQCSAVS